MHRGGEHRRVIAEDGRRAVALVYVEIDDGTAPHRAACLHAPGRDGDVVEDTEALATVGERVMRAPREIDGGPVCERRLCRSDRPADGASGSFHEFG